MRVQQSNDLASELIHQALKLATQQRMLKPEPLYKSPLRGFLLQHPREKHPMAFICKGEEITCLYFQKVARHFWAQLSQSGLTHAVLAARLYLTRSLGHTRSRQTRLVACKSSLLQGGLFYPFHSLASGPVPA